MIYGSINTYDLIQVIHFNKEANETENQWEQNMYLCFQIVMYKHVY